MSAGGRTAACWRGQDLAAWRASVEAPVRLDFAGLTVCKTGPWGQGPVFLQQLALLSGFGLAEMGPGSADFIHTVVECAKLAFADREAWYGDPRWSQVPLDALLSAEYASQRRPLVSGRASAELVPGSPGGAAPRLPGYALAGFRRGRAPPATRPPQPAGASGPARVSRWPSRPPGRGRPSSAPATRAIWTWPTGSATWSPPRRAAAGCRAPRSSPGSGSASAAGRRCSPSARASPAPWRRGRRPRTTLSPGLALRDGEPYLAFGTPGGDQQDQWTIGFFLNHVLFGMNLQEAIDAPGLPHRPLPLVVLPARLGAAVAVHRGADGAEQVIAGLRRRGHRCR